MLHSLVFLAFSGVYLAGGTDAPTARPTAAPSFSPVNLDFEFNIPVGIATGGVINLRPLVDPVQDRPWTYLYVFVLSFEASVLPCMHISPLPFSDMG